jgi:hypothetical protein
MREVLLTDVALWGALITIAALIIIRRWRRSHSWMPARGRRGEAPEPGGQKMSPPRAASMTGPDAGTSQSDRAASRPARPAPTASPQATQMPRPTARPHRPAAQRDDRQAPTSSERILSYYDQADQPIAGYLAALGWTRQPPTLPIRAAGTGPRCAADPREDTARSVKTSQEPARDRTGAKAASGRPIHTELADADGAEATAPNRQAAAHSHTKKQRDTR